MEQNRLMMGCWVEKPIVIPIGTPPHVMYTKEEDGVKYVRHAVEKCPCTMKKINGVLYWEFTNTGGGHNLRHKKSGEMMLPK